MDLPPLPTDSLYKFLALSGAVLFGLSLYLAVSLMKAYLARYDKVAFDADFLTARATWLTSRIEKAKASGKIEAHELEYIIENMPMMEESRAAFNTAHDRLNAWEKRARIVTIVLILLAVAGGSLAAFGFRLWYDRVQRYEDVILQERAATSKEKAGVSVPLWSRDDPQGNSRCPVVANSAIDLPAPGVPALASASCRPSTPFPAKAAPPFRRRSLRQGPRQKRR